MHNHHEHMSENSSKEEVLALLKFMINHNESHQNELIKLSEKIEDDNENAYRSTLEAINKFKEGNELLKTALNELEGK